MGSSGLQGGLNIAVEGGGRQCDKRCEKGQVTRISVMLTLVHNRGPQTACQQQSSSFFIFPPRSGEANIGTQVINEGSYRTMQTPSPSGCTPCPPSPFRSQGPQLSVCLTSSCVPPASATAAHNDHR